MQTVTTKTLCCLTIWCLSADNSLQRCGAATSINYMALCKGHLKLITNGLYRDVAEFVNIIQ